ncbi:MAG TPA: Npt1/Npt2 family nucleotide transporter [Holophagaceae bacterium]|nr:Npt1/Npt2 family nucleotide transporter [Holophagaceae bacterium]
MLYHKPKPEAGSPWRRLFLLKAGEGPLVAWSMGYFFCLLSAYYLLRPLREGMAIAKGADRLPWLMTATLGAMVLANPAFGALVSRWPRFRFIPASTRFFAASLLAFLALFRLLPAHGGAGLGYVFYVWLSVFNLFVVSVFWGFMGDLFNEEQGRRLFGLIAVGGTLGAIVGASATEALLQGRFGLRLDGPWLLLVSVAVLECAVQCMLRLGRMRRLAEAPPAREPGPGALEGLRLLGRNPYLAWLCAYILLFSLGSTLLYLQQGAIVAKAFPDQVSRTAAFARLDIWVNVLSLLLQLFFSGRIVSRLGVPATLLLLPLLTFAGFGALAVWPVFAVLMAFQVARRGLHYAVDRPARELIYIPLSPDEKYKSKPFIDTFVYRSGDLLGAWTPGALALVGIPMAAASLLGSAVWIGAAGWLGRSWRKARA